jgi:DNA-binding NtrC family response regulator
MALETQTIVDRQSSRNRLPSTDGGDKDSLTRTHALERIGPFVTARHSVLFEGEPGVGKRYHARLLHARTHAKNEGAFIELVPETPEDVLRAILFDEDRRLLEGKSGKRLPTLGLRSTLYLHDIAELSYMNQVLISRFLIEQEKQSPRTSTRLMASSTVPRSDLLQKLSASLSRHVEQLELCRIPPLRERLDELPSMVEAILVEVRRRENADCWRVTKEVLHQLEARQWRDNVRELEYVIGKAAVNPSDGTLKLHAQPSDEIEIVWEMFRTIQAGKRLAIDESLAFLEKAILERVLVKCGFDQRKTARMLAMTEPNLSYRIKKFNIYIPSSE